MTEYKMTTIYYGTRIRTDHNTAGGVLANVDANITVTGTDKFTADEVLQNSNGIYQHVGDIWIKVTYNDITGWMAFTHLGKPICSNLVEVGITPDPVPTFPEYFDLTDPQGNTKRYELVG